MDAAVHDMETLSQHLIDPEICIRCGACEAACPKGAISHDANNYVVDAGSCEHCLACIPGCPTGAIDNWITTLKARPYTVEEQFGWDELPEEAPVVMEEAAEPGPVGDAAGTPDAGRDAPVSVPPTQVESAATPVTTSPLNASLPPWSAAHAYTNLYGPKTGPITATVAGNFRVTQVGREYDTHHIVLDFGAMPFPVLEGQSIGIIPPGVDDRGRPHYARQFSVASPRNGERPGYNNVSLAVKRVLQDHDGNPVHGVGSNYMCDLQVGDKVQVIGPFGNSFLMPNHPGSSIVMICTGTGSAPMRAMTEWRRRLRASGKFEGGKLMLFFGARSKEDLPYFGPLLKLSKDFIDINFAFSRTPGQPRKYVQDVMRERAADLAPLLRDPQCYFYVCGLRTMEEGVLDALAEVAQGAGMDWDELGPELRHDARLHLETWY